jgi:hypothetical protein
MVVLPMPLPHIYVQQKGLIMCQLGMCEEAFPSLHSCTGEYGDVQGLTGHKVESHIHQDSQSIAYHGSHSWTWNLPYLGSIQADMVRGWMSSFQTVNTCRRWQYRNFTVVSNTLFRTYFDTHDLMIINSIFTTSTTDLENEMEICTCYTTVSPTINQEN